MLKCRVNLVFQTQRRKNGYYEEKSGDGGEVYGKKILKLKYQERNKQVWEIIAEVFFPLAHP